MSGPSPKDDIALRTVRGDRRVAAATLRTLMDRVDETKVTKARVPELEFEKELLLVAYQTLMKPPMMSPEEKRQQKENEEIIRLIDAELSDLD